MILAGMGLLATPLFAQETNLKKGLVAYYPFNGNANDESGNGKHLTVNGATLTENRFGEANSAYTFASNNKARLEGGESLNNLAQFTKSVWFRPTATKNTMFLQSGNGMLEYYYTHNRLYAYAFIDRKGALGFWGKTYEHWITATFKKNEWQHLVLSVDADNEAVVYLNGVRLNRTRRNYDNGVKGEYPKFVIGAGHDRTESRNNGYKGFFDGQIDDVRIYNRALGEAEVAALYEFEKKAPEPEVPDLSEFSHAIKFTSRDASIQLPNKGFGVGKSAWTFEFWLKIHDEFSVNGNNGRILVQNESWASKALRVRYYQSGTNKGKILFNVYDEGGLGGHSALSSTVNDSKWHHVAASAENQILKVFVDGKMITKKKAPYNLKAISSLSLGKPSGYSSYHALPGYLGPIRFSDIARYDSEFVPKTEWEIDGNTVAQYLSKNSLDGSTLIDEAGGDNNGKVRRNVESAKGPAKIKRSIITAHPESGRHPAGTDVTLSVGVDEAHLGAFIQWFKDGQAVAGANAADFLIANASPDDAGLYYAMVVAGGEALTSDKAEIVILVKPVVTAISENAVADEGETLELVVTAKGDAPLRYEWKKTGSGAVLSRLATLTLAKVNETHSGEYYVVVSNEGGSVTSTGVTLFVRPDTDNDGLLDHVEAQLGTDIHKADTDGDGVGDFAEVRTHETNPLSADSDGDGLPDGVELSEGFDPLVGTEAADGALAVHTAVELEFFTLKSRRYVIQSSTDLETWEDASAEFQGTGGFYSVFASTRDEPHQFWRLKAVD